MRCWETAGLVTPLPLLRVSPGVGGTPPSRDGAPRCLRCGTPGSETPGRNQLPLPRCAPSPGTAVGQPHPWRWRPGSTCTAQAPPGAQRPRGCANQQPLQLRSWVLAGHPLPAFPILCPLSRTSPRAAPGPGPGADGHAGGARSRSPVLPQMVRKERFPVQGPFPERRSGRTARPPAVSSRSEAQALPRGLCGPEPARGGGGRGSGVGGSRRCAGAGRPLPTGRSIASPSPVRRCATPRGPGQGVCLQRGGDGEAAPGPGRGSDPQLSPSRPGPDSTLHVLQQHAPSSRC